MSRDNTTSQTYRPFADALKVETPLFSIMFVAMLAVCTLADDISPRQTLLFVSIAALGVLFALGRVWLSGRHSITITSDQVIMQNRGRVLTVNMHDVQHLEMDERPSLRLRTGTATYVMPLFWYRPQDRRAIRDHFLSHDQPGLSIVKRGRYRVIWILLAFLMCLLMSPLVAYLMPLTWIDERLTYPESAQVVYVFMVLIFFVGWGVNSHRVATRVIPHS